MSYSHGIKATERATSVKPPSQVDSALTVAVGTAPVNLIGKASLNKPLLALNYNEAVSQLGFSSDYKNFTLCEVMDTHFKLFNVGPVVFINVLDPEKHITEELPKTLSVKNKQVLVDKEGVLLDSVTVKSADGLTDYVKDTDYTAVFNDEGKVVISVVPDGQIVEGTTELQVGYTYLDKSKVTDEDIIGGYDAATGTSTGMELLNSVFPLYRKIPGILIAPGFSQSPTVAAIMKSKVKSINGIFKAMHYVDIDTTAVNVYSKAVEHKNQNNLVDGQGLLFWGNPKLGDKVYNFSSQAAALTAQVDAQNGGTPHVSPSNKSLQMDALVVNDKEVALGQNQAAYLNSNGIITALNFIGGWKLWGNRTSVYPDNTDVKDSFTSVKRMFIFLQNTFITSFWSNVDDPANRRLIDQFLDSANIYLNGLTSDGSLLGGRLEFRQDENPTTSLLDGKVTFHLFIGSPTPAREIEFLVEFDVSYLNSLFE
jgi:uncharacterized protein